MTELTPKDVALIRQKELLEMGITKSFNTIYKNVVNDFASGKIPSIVKHTTSNGRAYRYTTPKLLQMKETREANKVAAKMRSVI